MKPNWKTAFMVAVVLLGWVAAIELFVIMNQSTTIDVHKKKCAELEGDLKALVGLLPGRLSKADLSGHQFQRLTFLYSEGDTVVSARYQWDKFR